MKNQNPSCGPDCMVEFVLLLYLLAALAFIAHARQSANKFAFAFA